MASSAIAYSYPPLLTAKPAGQRTVLIAVAIVQASRNAPRRVSRPRKTNMLPSSSENAAAPHQSQAGRMKANGAGPECTKLLSPGPPKLPNTFSAPWTKKTAANANLIGIVAHDDEVEIILLNMAEILPAGNLRERHQILTGEQGNRGSGEQVKRVKGKVKTSFLTPSLSPFPSYPSLDLGWPKFFVVTWLRNETAKLQTIFPEQLVPSGRGAVDFGSDVLSRSSRHKA